MMLGVNFDLSIASKLMGYTPVFLKPDCICHHHAVGLGRVEYIPKGGLRQKLSLSVVIPLSEIPLPQLFKLYKWGGV